jgi:hypothetical protein
LFWALPEELKLRFPALFCIGRDFPGADDETKPLAGWLGPGGEDPEGEALGVKRTPLPQFGEEEELDENDTFDEAISAKNIWTKLIFSWFILGKNRSKRGHHTKHTGDKDNKE